MNRMREAAIDGVVRKTIGDDSRLRHVKSGEYACALLQQKSASVIPARCRTQFNRCVPRRRECEGRRLVGTGTRSDYVRVCGEIVCKKGELAQRG